MGGAVPPLPLYAFMAQTGKSLFLLMLIHNRRHKISPLGPNLSNCIEVIISSPRLQRNFSRIHFVEVFQLNFCILLSVS
jgi:hypothetical protein